ncbi:hypothetical protein [Paraburkholderia sp.]
MIDLLVQLVVAGAVLALVVLLVVTQERRALSYESGQRKKT